MPARIINIKYITIRAEKVASPVTALHTAQHSSSGRQPNFAALNRGRHLYSAGRPSRWALAHILVCNVLALEGWRKRNNAPSIRSLVVDEERRGETTG